MQRKFVFGRDSASHPVVEDYSDPPDPLAVRTGRGGGEGGKIRKYRLHLREWGRG